VGPDTDAEEDDPHFQAIVGGLSMKSERFRQLWARHDVSRVEPDRRRARQRRRRPHPAAEKLAVVGGEGLVVVMYDAESGSTDADELALLSSRG
jgi:hypothetical protein